MSFFSQFSDFIDGPVGNALKNLPEDVRRVKRNFKTIGIFDDDTENGYMTRELDDAIKVFQRDNDLKVDGRINPRGETESRIWDVLSGGLEKIGNAGRSRTIEEAPQRGIGFGTGLTDFKVGKDDMPDTGTFVPKAPQQKPRNPYIMSLNDHKPETDATGRMIREQKETKDSVRGFDEKEFLDKVENTYREYVKESRRKGLNDTSNNLEHFLNGSGTDKVLSREEARDKLFVRNGEETNRKRFTQGFISKTKTGSKILGMKDGETINVKDNWDYKVGNFPVETMIKNADLSRSHILRGDFDEAFATGTSFVKSKGNFKARRVGNTVFIDGIVDHQWEDTYDFDPAKSAGAGAVALEKAGKAKSYDIRSNWQQRVTGTMQIKNGKLINPKLTWQDIESDKNR